MTRILLIFFLGLTAAPAAAESLATREFHAQMSAGEETGYVESAGNGAVDLVVDLKNLELSWRVVFKGLTSAPVAVTLHGPAQPGANGVVILDLAEGDLNSPVEGKATLNEAQVQFMLNRWTYVSVRTKKYPKGEIRGLITAVRPKLEY